MKKVEKHTIEKWVDQIAQENSKTESDKSSLFISEDLNSEFEAYKKTWKILKEMENIEQFDNDKAWDKLFAKIVSDEKEMAKHKPKTIILNKVLAIAASVILLVSIGGFYFYSQMGNFSYLNSNLTSQVIKLPDGSEVYLNANSEISYTKKFGKATREVALSGEAFFSVTKDKTKPFLVKMRNGYVKVLGTSFNVNAKTDEVEVVVKTGRVEVYNNSNSAEHVILFPGDCAFLDGKGKLEKNKNSNENYLSWMNQKLIFKSLPLKKVVNDLMNTYHCNIELADPKINNLKITSTFDNDNIDEVLESISLAFNLKIIKEEKKYILVSK